MIPIFPWLAGGATDSPAKLAAWIVDRFTTDVNGIWIGDDIVDSGGVVTSWPSRLVGGTLTNATANRFAVGQLNGRKTLAPGTIAELKALGWAGGVAEKTAISVVACPASGGVNDTVSDSFPESSNAIIGQPGGVFGGGTFLVRHVDGVLINTIPNSGAHVIQTYGAGNTYTGISVGGLSFVQVRTWREKIACRISLKTQIDAADRAAILDRLRRYYRL